MFDPVNDLAKRLPRPAMTGDAIKDGQIVDVYVANARRMRSEAFACMGKALVRVVTQGWRRTTSTPPRGVSYQA
jgi:hypothetical protein